LAILHQPQGYREIGGFQLLWKIVVPSLKMSTYLTQQTSPKHKPKKTKNTCSQKDLHMNIHSNVVMVAEKWKQSKCPLIGEWINKMKSLPRVETIQSYEK
jgi:hypothetical protein